MAIKLVPDLGAPIAVTAVDLLLEKFAPEYTKWATGAMALGGYVGAYMGFGGDFVKNVGISALPAFAKNLYDYIVGGGTTTTRRANATAFRRAPVSRWPAPATQTEFANTRITRLV